MKSDLYDRNIDLKAYARKRLLEMDSLEDRQLLKALLNEVIHPCIGYLEDAYLSLENRIFDEMVLSKHVPLFIGMARQDEYDATDDHMFPIVNDDVGLVTHTVESIQDAIEEKGQCFYQKILLEVDYIDCQKIIKESRIYDGLLYAEDKEIAMTYKLVEDKSYDMALQSLFDIFSLNYLEWSSVSAPYFKKVFKVEIPTIDKEARGKVTGHRYLSPDLNKDIIENPILLWNITNQSVKTSSYPEPCVDSIHYDHRIVASKLDDKSRYLVCNTDIYISNIRRINGDLVITTDMEEPRDFELLRITDKGSYYYEARVFGNERDENFISSYKRSAIKTKAELSRLITAYDYNEDVRFLDCESVQQSKDEVETYNVDLFEQDEIRMEKYKPSLLIKFQAVDFSPYSRDIMSFLISVIQKHFPEYQCKGQLSRDKQVI